MKSIKFKLKFLAIETKMYETINKTLKPSFFKQRYTSNKVVVISQLHCICTLVNTKKDL